MSSVSSSRPSKATHVGAGEVYVVPSRTDDTKVYGVSVVTFEGKTAFFCNCPANVECWHIREVQLAMLQERPKLELVVTPPERKRGLDFSQDEPWDWEHGCPIGAC